VSSIKRLIDCMKNRVGNKLPDGFDSWEAFAASNLTEAMGWGMATEGNKDRLKPWIDGSETPDEEEEEIIQKAIAYWCRGI